ncbi:uncharacterized protein KGF55_001415 [Candida pseudojiufengensis]|uniref:uncharacterized protein n=1 Tax=Candida pseudojiufengensis TaxID=497109 RepID=UPI002224DF64|nr:uncharacterized protein KGF55_001415 [Candida pseudojiufengensis]KAI5965195.1 hypothetical protein KGF55_001415 [Candida pseudojiufengensis]
MGYKDNFKVVTKTLSNNILLAATSFKRFDKINFGNRMAIFKYPSGSPDSVIPRLIIWSPLPYSPNVLNVINEFSGVSSESNLDIAYVIVPDREHNLAAKLYKEKFPNTKIIGVENTENVPLDYTFIEKQGNKLISGETLKEFIDDELIYKNFDFVYLPYHANSELVVYEKNSKTLFEADLLFNLGDPNEKLEQFSPALGYPENYNPHFGWSFLTRYLQPYSKVGVFMFDKLVNLNKSKPGLEAIYSLDFNTIVMCHGNIITKDAKKAFKNVFLHS